MEKLNDVLRINERTTPLLAQLPAIVTASKELPLPMMPKGLCSAGRFPDGRYFYVEMIPATRDNPNGLRVVARFAKSDAPPPLCASM
jgi:hypothetical protein